VRRVLCNCHTTNFANGLRNAANWRTGIAVIALFISPAFAGATAAGNLYFYLLASRLDANNRGRGVIADTTWALVFNITPQ